MVNYPMGISSLASADFTPAAASHTAGDVNGGAGRFRNVGTPGARMRIDAAELLIAGATIETTAWTLHLYNVTPPSALADDAAFDIPSGDRAAYLGFITIPQVVDYGSSLYIQTLDLAKHVRLKGTDLWGYLVNGTTLTPAAVAHTVKLHSYAV